ncbi:MAG TPA: hypothetical protein VGE26_01905 [Sphingobacteriaceae bacterium]
MTTHELIRQYILDASLSDNGSISDDTLIFEQGLLDSMGLLFLVQFLNDELQVRAEDHELSKENFESINAIVSYINKKRQTGPVVAANL